MKQKLFLAMSLIILLSSSFASAAIIGVSPSIIRFNKMLKGGYAETTVTITTSTELPIKAHFTKEGDTADWITLDPEKTEFNFSRTSPYSFTFIMQPPADAKNGNYSGVLKMTTDELATVDRGAGSSVVAQVALLIYVEIVGDEIIQCRAGAISTTSSESGDPFTVRATVYNDGNVRLRPEITVDVWNQYQTKILFTKSFFGDQILPTKNKEIVQEIANELPVGQYFAETILQECGITKTTTFDIVDKGEIADGGVLMAINANDVTYAKEPMKIGSLFQNTGSRKVVAQFKGEIRNLKTNKISGVLESDKLTVNPGETMEFSMFYVPADIGDYQVSGRVVYNNKITFNEQSKVIKVVDSSSGMTGWISKISGQGSLFFIMIYFVVGLLILILIGKIRKARKKSF